MTRQFTLGKQERLKSRKLIEQVFNEGKGFSIFPFRVYYLSGHSTFGLQTAGFHAQIGVGASSKTFKKSVERNRIKRLMREACRLQKNNLNQLLQERKLQLVLFVVYSGKELPEYQLVYDKIGLILQKLSNIISEKSPSNT
ncbi:MAG: ribonuclease P protein component [Bacteroidetes bacterium]|nr:ribonuclease P protein component [Bacteroidota bacterium]MBS1973476.1 ribonuclease P protein component [Bacteroidota bacterium]